MKIENETKGEYLKNEATRVSLSDDAIIEQARQILASRLNLVTKLTSAKKAMDYLRMELETLEYESFFVIYLNTKHKVIDSHHLFRGTIDQASVYPREIIKEALTRNAKALIIAHNHPSGNIEPSLADNRITKEIQEACALVGVRLLDHIIVGQNDTFSYAEKSRL